MRWLFLCLIVVSCTPVDLAETDYPTEKDVVLLSDSSCEAVLSEQFAGEGFTVRYPASWQLIDTGQKRLTREDATVWINVEPWSHYRSEQLQAIVADGESQNLTIANREAIRYSRQYPQPLPGEYGLPDNFDPSDYPDLLTIGLAVIDGQRLIHLRGQAKVSTSEEILCELREILDSLTFD